MLRIGLVVVMLTCPLVCRASTCCGPTGISPLQAVETDGNACPHCAEETRQRIPPMSPRPQGRQGQCLCGGVTVPAVAGDTERAQGMEAGAGEARPAPWQVGASAAGRHAGWADEHRRWGRRLCQTVCSWRC